MEKDELRVFPSKGIEDRTLCIICREETKETLCSTEDGKSNIIKASVIRKNKIQQRLKNINENLFCYHYSCYNAYVQKTYV